jgi:hypothetical protein
VSINNTIWLSLADLLCRPFNVSIEATDGLLYQGSKIDGTQNIVLSGEVVSFRVAEMSTTVQGGKGPTFFEGISFEPSFFPLAKTSTIIPSGLFTNIAESAYLEYGDFGDAIVGEFFHPLVEVSCNSGVIKFGNNVAEDTALNFFPALDFPNTDAALAQAATLLDIKNNMLPEQNTTSLFTRLSPSSYSNSTLLVSSEVKPEHNNTWSSSFCQIRASWIKAETRSTLNTGMTITDNLGDLLAREKVKMAIIIEPELILNVSKSLKLTNNQITARGLSLSLARVISNILPVNITGIFTGNSEDFSFPMDGVLSDSQYTRILYSYRIDSVSVILSIIVLLIYSAIAAIYLIHTLMTGETSSSWDTVSELFMLAINTRPPSHIKNTSAGIATLATMKEPVSIRVNENGSLEMVFENEPQSESMRFRKVEPNIAY